MSEESTTKIKVDLSEMKKEFQEAQRQIRLVNSEFKAATSGMNNWANSADGLSAKTKQLTGVLNAETTKLASLKQQYEIVARTQGTNSKAAQELMIKINNQSAAVQRTYTSLTQYTQQLNNVRSESSRTATASEQLHNTINEQESTLGELKAKYADLILTQGKNSAEAKECANQIKGLSHELQTNRSSMENASNAADNLDATLEEVDDSSERVSEGFSVMKATVANLVADGIKKAAGALANFVKNSITVGSEFKASMSEVAAISGAQGKDFELLEETAKKYGATTVFSASESAQALKYMALAGWDAQKSSSALGGVLDLASASGMDLAKASDMVTDYLSAFGMKAEQSTYFADMLAYSQSKANTSAEQLGEAYKNCAANLNAAGQDVETVTSLLSMMANQGFKGSEAGTALTAIMRDITAKMKKGSVQIGKTSIQVQKSNGDYRDLTDILKDVEKATDGMGDAQRASALSTTFTSDSTKGLNLLLNAGVGEAEKFESALRKSSGTANDMGKTMNDNLAGDIKAAQSAMEDLQIATYDELEPSLRSVVQYATSNIIPVVKNEAIPVIKNELIPAVREFIKYGTEHMGEIIPVAKNVSIALASIFVVNKVAKFTTSIKTLVSAGVGLVTNIRNVSTTAGLLGTVLGNLPFIAATAGVAALAGGMIYLYKKNKEAIQAEYGLTDAQKKSIEKSQELKDAYSELAKSRENSFSNINSEYNHISELKDEYNGLINSNGKVKKSYEDRANFILTELAKSLGVERDEIDKLIDKNGKLGKSIDKVIEKKQAEAILSANENAYTQAVQKKTEALNNYQTALDTYKTAEENYKNAQEDSSKAMEEYTEYLKRGNQGGAEVYLAANKKIIDGAQEAKTSYEEAKKGLQDAEDAYVGYNTTIANYEGLSSAIISGDTKKIQSALQNMQINFETASTGTEKSLQKQVANMQENYKNMQNAINEGTPGVTQAMVGQAQTMVDKSFNELVKKSKLNGVKIPQNLAQGVRDGSISVQDAIKTLENIVKLDKAVKKANVAGGKIPTELSKGIASGKVSVEEAQKRLSDAIKFKELADKSGKMGKKTVKNLTEGILNGTTTAQDAGKKLAEATVKGQKDGAKGSKANGTKAGKDFASSVKSKKAEADKSGKEIGKSSTDGAKSGSNNMKKTGSTAGSNYAQGVGSKTGDAKSKGTALGKNANDGAKSYNSNAYTSGTNFSQGFINGIGSLVSNAFSKAKALAERAWEGLKKGQKEGSPSKLTTQSGKYFGEGFNNGIESTSDLIVHSAAKLVKKAVKIVSTSSSSKLTCQSGKNFVANYIAGIVKEEGKLENIAKNMVKTVANAMLKINGFDFSSSTENVSSKFETAMSNKVQYISDKAQYLNDQKISSLESKLSKYEEQQSKYQKQYDTAKSAYDKAKNNISKVEKNYAKKLRTYNEAKSNYDKALANYNKASKKDKSKYKKQLDSAKKRLNNVNYSLSDYNKQTKADKKTMEMQSKKMSAAKKQVANYKKLVKDQKTFNEAYQNASSEMLSELSTALSQYQSKAQDLINDTINEISDKYQAKYDALTEKQDNLISKLKSAGSLFDISSAGIMTVNDIKQQTKEIQDYANKLQKIKNKVSADLFDEITNYDMDEGSAFVDRLLAMSDKELKAYSDAYDNKNKITESLSKKIYQKDFENIKKAYNEEVKKAFASLPSKLEKLGDQVMKGFVKGLKGNTDYMTKTVKTMIKSMVDTFKKDLKIHSPSRVTREIGNFVGLGFGDGIVDSIRQARKDARAFINSIAEPFDSIQLGAMKGNVNAANVGKCTSSNQTIINNYNLVQNNTSPKSLSALETYRARRQQVSMLKAMTQ